jgi:hypothetical protein
MRAIDRAAQAESPTMMDIGYLTLTAILLALSWGLVRLCERV